MTFSLVFKWKFLKLVAIYESHCSIFMVYYNIFFVSFHVISDKISSVGRAFK